MDLKRDDHVKLRARHFHIPRSYGRDKVFRLRNPKGCPMPEVIYEIVEHDGGWAYKVDGGFRNPSQPMPRRSPLRRMAAAEQEIPGHTETIEYDDEKGKWHTETASGRDRPHTVVTDKD